MVCTIATVQLKEGQLEQFLRYLRGGVIARARNMQGCHDYAVYVDQPFDGEYALQPRPNVVTIIGKWDDEATWKEHRESLHMFDLLWDATDLVESVTVRLLGEA